MLINCLTPSPDFRELMRRLMTGDPKHPRPVEWTEPLNIFATDPRIVAILMEATAHLSVRCTRPAFAFTISWHADENPTTATMKTVAIATLEHAGLGEHQAFIICPADRVHPCLRVLVNRIHPDTGKAYDLYQNYRRFDRIAKQLAEEHGFRHVPFRHRAEHGV